MESRRLADDAPGSCRARSGRELIGTFDNEEQAVVEGARRFGMESFLVKRIAPRILNSRRQHSAWGFSVPILHVQLAGQGLAPDGTSITVAPPEVLLQRRADCPGRNRFVESHRDDADRPRQADSQSSIRLGADRHRRFMHLRQRRGRATLGLPAIDKIKISSASADSAEHNVYPVHVEILGARLGWGCFASPWLPVESKGLIALIGRDWLRQGTIFYNGISGQFTLSIG